MGIHKSTNTSIVPRDHPRVEMKDGDEVFDADDARAMSPRRSSQDLEKIGQEARAQLNEHAKVLKESLLNISKHIDIVNKRHDKLVDNNRLLQKYIRDTMAASTTSANARNVNASSGPCAGDMVNKGEIASYSTASAHSLSGSRMISGRDPRHYLNHSLGELHQELELEQEARANRLLQVIRTQQQQLRQLRAVGGLSVIDECTTTSERSISFSATNATLSHSPASAVSTPRSPSAILCPRSPFCLARSDVCRRSAAASRTASPGLRSSSIREPFNLNRRDETAFYQAETQMAMDENQKLRQRIRELERQVSELHTTSAATHYPPTTPQLLLSTSVSEEAPSPTPGVISRIEAGRGA